jgi:L-tartrate/succinate antiporter
MPHEVPNARTQEIRHTARLPSAVAVRASACEAAPLSIAGAPAAPAVKSAKPGKARVSWKAVAPVAVAALIAVVPAPHGLPQHAWWYFALFAGVIVGLILEPLPAAAIGFIGITVAVTLGFIGDTPGDSLKWGLSGFANDTVWLIFTAYMFAEGYEKTGLGRRIALLLVSALGKRTLGLGYAVALSDLVLAPFTPSNTARSGGTIFPIIKNIPPLYGSLPGESSRKIGAYLLYTAFATTCVTSSMFLTALAPNLLAVEIIAKSSGIHISWMQWFVGFLPIGATLFLVVPALLYVIYPPEVKSGGEVVTWARSQLHEMGGLSGKEILMGVLAIAALVLWIAGGSWIAATTVALLVVSAMIVTGILSWNDLLAYKQAWSVLVWFATLVALADGLNKVGFLPWFGKLTAHMLNGVSPLFVVIGLIVVFFVVHYLFASITAQATALLPVFIASVAAMAGVPILTIALLLAFSLGLMGVITPYACGPAPIYFGSGYIEGRDFWKLGAILGALFLLALLAIGVPYVSATQHQAVSTESAAPGSPHEARRGGETPLRR